MFRVLSRYIFVGNIKAYSIESIGSNRYPDICHHQKWLHLIANSKADFEIAE